MANGGGGGGGSGGGGGGGGGRAVPRSPSEPATVGWLQVSKTEQYKRVVYYTLTMSYSRARWASQWW